MSNRWGLFAVVLVTGVLLALSLRILMMMRRHRRRNRLMMTSSPSLHSARMRIYADRYPPDERDGERKE